MFILILLNEINKKKEDSFEALNTACLTYFCGKSTALSRS
jgi:hypothetical protein